jgi:hypothetical protein
VSRPKPARCGEDSGPPPPFERGASRPASWELEFFVELDCVRQVRCDPRRCRPNCKRYSISSLIGWRRGQVTRCRRAGDSSDRTSPALCASTWTTSRYDSTAHHPQCTSWARTRRARTHACRGCASPTWRSRRHQCRVGMGSTCLPRMAAPCTSRSSKERRRGTAWECGRAPSVTSGVRATGRVPFWPRRSPTVQDHDVNLSGDRRQEPSVRSRNGRGISLRD